MNCPSCGLSVPGSNRSEALRAARCTACDTLFDTSGSSRLVPQRPAPALAFAAPGTWQVDDQGSHYTARWRWFSPSALFLLPFAAFWNGILVVMAWSSTEGGAHPERLLLGLAVPHVWVGVGLIYWVLATFLNTTTVRLADGQLTVRHGPLWWPGGRLTLPRAELRQLFVVDVRNRNSVTFQLCALLRDGKRQVVVRSFRQEADARYLEAKLEQLLGIADQRVAGEAPRG